MNQNPRNTSHPSPFVKEASQAQPEETLRLLSRLEPPIGVADRVHYRLQQARNEEPEPRPFWSQWMPVRRFQYAGAAMLAIAVGASTWSLYRHPVAPTKTPIHGTTSQGTFGSAAATRRPSTLAPIKVTPVPKKKPSAARPKTVPHPAASQPAETSASKAAVNP